LVSIYATYLLAVSLVDLFNKLTSEKWLWT